MGGKLTHQYNRLMRLIQAREWDRRPPRLAQASDPKLRRYSPSVDQPFERPGCHDGDRFLIDALAIGLGRAAGSRAASRW